jgi:polar amino acid transport system substrate-binding protein
MLVFLSPSWAATPPRIDIYTEEFPPYQTLVAPGKVGGVASNLVEQVMSATNLPYRIHLLPWYRSTTNVLKYKNSLIYSLARTDERETKYHWLVPLCSIDVSFYKLADREDIVVNSIEDASKFVVAVAAGQPSEAFLVKHGFTLDKNLVVLASHEQGAGMLEKKRIDLLFGADQFFKGVVESLNLEGHWQSIYTVEELSRVTYLATSIASDQDFVNQIKTGYKAVADSLNQVQRCKAALN